MDEMFVPYKEMFESPVKKATKSIPVIVEKESFFKSKWIWIALVLLILILLAALVLRRIQTEEEVPYQVVPPTTEITKTIEIIKPAKQEVKFELKPEIKPEPKNPEAKPVAVEVKSEVKTEVKPEVKPEAKPKPEILDYETPQLLAKGVGLKLRDLLLKHKQIPPLQVAEIVSATVRVLLGENERVAPAVVAVTPAAEVKLPEQRLPEPRKDGPKVKAPEIQDEPEPEEPKRGKINADTDPALLRLLKERGMSN